MEARFVSAWFSVSLNACIAGLALCACGNGTTGTDAGPGNDAPADQISPADARGAGEQRSCAAAGTPGCGLVEVSGGLFQMGDNDTSTGAYGAAPVVAVTVGPFAMDAYEVTVARFRIYWDSGHPAPSAPIAYRAGMIAWAGSVVEPTATGCSVGANWGVTGREGHPIQCVDSWTALAFCAWDGGRLPTESEWEYAARAQGGGAIRTYPWGEAADSRMCDRAQWAHCAGDDGAITRRVGSFAATNGMYDLAGNVWEWTADNWVARHDDARCNRTGATDPLCNTTADDRRVIRGGSWQNDDGRDMLSATRDSILPVSRTNYVGFRCARTR